MDCSVLPLHSLGNSRVVKMFSPPAATFAKAEPLSIEINRMQGKYCVLLRMHTYSLPLLYTLHQSPPLQTSFCTRTSRRGWSLTFVYAKYLSATNFAISCCPVLPGQEITESTSPFFRSGLVDCFCSRIPRYDRLVNFAGDHLSASVL